MNDETYKKFVAPYAYAMNLVMAHLKNIQAELLASPTIRNPINSINGRIKSLDSLNKKCQKDKYKIDPEDKNEISKRIHDIAGIRITCVYLKDIDHIREYIEKIPGVFIQVEKDYIKNPKKSGYQSLHLIISIEIYTLTNGLMKIPIEVQIRTLNMQAWAQVEHRARYKNDLGDNAMDQELLCKIQCAAQLAADLDVLYEEILSLSGEE